MECAEAIGGYRRDYNLLHGGRHCAVSERKIERVHQSSRRRRQRNKRRDVDGCSRAVALNCGSVSIEKRRDQVFAQDNGVWIVDLELAAFEAACAGYRVILRVVVEDAG